MEMAAGKISVEDYEEAGLVLSAAAELLDLVIEKRSAAVSAGVDVKGKQPLGGDDDQKAPEMGTDNCAAGKKEKTEWQIEMETTAVGKTEDQWPPGLWEFERDEYYFQWILYCPDAFVLHSHQLPAGQL